MRVFVTGATGLLGRRVLRSMSKSGHEMTALVRRERSSWEGRIIVGDLLDPRSYRDALAGFDAVLHMAAVTRTNDTDLYYRVNRDGTQALLRAAEQAGVRRFAFVSSRAVGADGGAYSDSKAQAEEIVRRSELPWMILRPAEVYGPGVNEPVSRVIEAAATGWVVIVPGDGSHQLAPLYVDDLIAAVEALLGMEPFRSGCYTLAGPEILSFCELVDRVAAVAGRSPLRIHVPLEIVSLAAAALALLPIRRPPLVRDQLARLVLAKDADIGPARTAIGFTPRSVESYVAERLAISQ